MNIKDAIKVWAVVWRGAYGGHVSAVFDSEDQAIEYCNELNYKDLMNDTGSWHVETIPYYKRGK